MSKLTIASLAGIFFLAIAPATWAQDTTDGNTPDWSSMSADDLLWAARNLTGDDPNVAAARQSIVDQLSARFLTEATATRSITCHYWRDFSKCLLTELSVQQRGQWAGKIRAAYVQDAAGLASLKTEPALTYLIGALRELGDPQAAAVAATFTLGSTAWQSWEATRLIGLARRLSQFGNAGADARLAVSATVASRYLPAGSVTSLSLSQWRDLTKYLGSDLSAEAKAQWAASIAQAFAGSGEAAVSLSAKDTELLAAILSQLDAKDLATELVARLTGDSGALQSMSAGQLIWAIRGFVGDAPAMKAARQNIADLLTTKFLADNAATRSVSCGRWIEFVGRLSEELTDEQRGLWAGKFRAAYAQDAAGLASLKTGTDLDYLIRALGKLGDKEDDLNGVVAAFVKGTTHWQSWPPKEVVALATRIARLGELGAAAREILITTVASRYLSAETAKSLALGQWKSLAGALAEGLSEDAKSQWASTVTQAYAGSGEAAGALAPTDVQQLITALDSLAARDLAVDTLARLVNGSTSWHSWDLDSQVWLTGVLASPDSREATKPARLRILERITATYMLTTEEVKKVPLRQWASLVMGLHDVMPDETTTLWAQRLRGIFSSAALAALGADVKQRRALLPVIAILDDKMKTGLALSWLKDYSLWQGSPIEALAGLARAAYRDDRDETTQVLDELHAHCVARHATQPLTLSECIALRDTFVRAGQMPRAQQWVWVACDVTIGTATRRAVVDEATVVKLSIALNDTGMSGKTRDHPEFAAARAAAAARGALDPRTAGRPKCRGESLGTASMRQTVRDALLDASGNPRLGAAKVLACAYRMYGELKPWRDYVSQQVAAATDGQDRKALWLLVKGYTDSVIPDSQNLLRVEVGATMALGHASADAVRILAVRELADSYEQTSRPGVGASVIESMKNQFTGDSLAAIESMQENLLKREEARLLRTQREKAAAAAARKKALLAYYRKCLTQATAGGDLAEAAKLQAAIARLSGQ